MRNFTLFCVFMTSKLVFCFPCPDHCLTCDSSKSCVSCKDGYWGNICELPCSRCQQGTSCEKTNGFCLEKCKDGYTGILCDAFCNDKCLKCDRMNAGLCYLCAPGRYGVSCDKRCSEFCYNNTCNENGYCSCISGYWGPKCENNCSSNCKNSSCDYQTGACTYGCTGIFIGSRCDSASRQKPVILIVIVVLIVGLIVGILAVCFIFRKILQRRRTRQDEAEAPAEIPLLNRIEMMTSEDSGVCIKGFLGDNTYLVCRDHTAETGDLLWEMVWKRNCNVIVNLSSCVEETEEQRIFLKTEGKQTYGSVSVTYMGGIDFDDYEEKQYELEKLTEKKQVTQMQFSHWPRSGLPENLSKLFNVRQKLKQVRTGPLLVHCSGDQNRSYTYIALDKALNELEREDNADIPAEPYLNRLRSEGLISSDEQYAFLRRIIDLWKATRYLQIKEEEVSKQDIYTSLEIDSPRAFLEYRYVRSLSSGKTYIICKDPTEPKKDAAAFWKTVWQQNCYVIVTLRTMTEMTLKDTYRYWPYDNKTKTFDSISVTTKGVQNTTYLIRRTLEIEKLNDRRRVTQLQFPLWLPDSYPKSKTELLEFRQKVQEFSKDQSGPLLIHCSDGKSRSGLYTALDMVLTDLERQDHVDMPLDHYIEQLRAAHLLSTETNNEIEFLSSTIESWKSSREAQNSSSDHLKS